MTADLHHWARHRHDDLIGWGDADDELMSFVVDEATYQHVSFAINFGRAHSRLSRRVEEIVSEFRAHDPESVRRWAGRNKS